MTRHSSTFLAALAFSLRLLSAQAQALRQQYCSNQNTGSDYRPDTWTWQSNGRCFDTCKSQYAFAVVQDQNCWCSNYIPAQQQDVGACNSNCPGYPDEKCGNRGSGLFGYIALNNRPSGTAGASSPSPTPSRIPQSTSSPPPPPPPPASTDTPSSSQQQQQQPSSSQAPSSPSDSPSPSPITSVYVVTVSGAAITQTVTSIPTAALEASQQPQGSGRTSSGTIAGAVVGGVAGLAAVGGLLIWLLLNRKRRESEDDDPDAERSGTSPRRNTSTLSKTGLLRSAEKEYPPVAIPATNRSSTLANDQDTSSPTSERRSSRPLFYDQRLNPSALMDLDNGSHTSIITMEDNRDYTRTLNIRNPDPSS